MSISSLYSLVGQIVSNSNLQSCYQFPNIPCQSVQIHNHKLKLHNDILLSNWTGNVIRGTINKIYRNKNNKHIKLIHVEKITNGGIVNNYPTSLTISVTEIQNNWTIQTFV